MVAKKFFTDYSGILHTDGYIEFENDIGTKDMIHTCCRAGARCGFIESLNVQKMDSEASRWLECVVACFDGLFAIARHAREQCLSLNAWHMLMQEHAPANL